MGVDNLLWKVACGIELWVEEEFHLAALAMGAQSGQVDRWVNRNKQQEVGANVSNTLPISTHLYVLSENHCHLKNPNLACSGCQLWLPHLLNKRLKDCFRFLQAACPRVICQTS